MADCGLLATALLERDQNADLLWTWVYPSVADGLREVLQRNADEAGLLAADLSEEKSTFFRVGNVWCYLTAFPTAEVESLPATLSVTNVILAKDFDPEKYQTLSKLFFNAYAAGGDATAILQLYLKVTVSGSCKGFKSGNFDPRNAYLEGSIKEVIKTLGVETILVYTALLIKKRVAVFNPDPAALIGFTRVLPQLVLARQDWSILRPWTHLVDEELADLADARTYVAGFTEPEIENREDLYDVFVNASDGSVRVSTASKDDFALGKVHKEIATFLISAADDEGTSEQDLLKELAQRTKDLTAGLMKLATPSESDPDQLVVKPDAINSRKMQSSMQTFLLNLAIAENVLEM